MDGLNVEWECPSCTLINQGVTYRCKCCGLAKGTSTRQTKLHYTALEQQYAAESFLTNQKIPSKVSLSKNAPFNPETINSDATEEPLEGNAYNRTVATGRGKRLKKSSLTVITPSSSGNSGGGSVKLSAQKSSSQIFKQRMQWPRLKNIDRTSGKKYSITVNSVTVTITEYELLQ